MSTVSISTHVLDVSAGTPAVGIHVSLSSVDNGVECEVARTTTGQDGRARLLDPTDGRTSGEGGYKLRFDVKSYFGDVHTFYHLVEVTFTARPGHNHVPLLLSPYSYTTYRGC